MSNTSVAVWDEIIDVPTKRMRFLPPAVVPFFLRRCGGVGLTSSTNRVPPDRAHYSASQCAPLSMIKFMTWDYAADSLCVKCHCLRTIDTESLQERLGAKSDAEQDRKQFFARQSLRCPGTAEEVARVALYLVSNEAGFVTGAALQIDGGVSL